MHVLKDSPRTFYCFSPPVMAATFLIEIVCAIYTLVRYKLNPVTRLAAIILVCLAIFQLAEYNVCEGAFGISSLDWARVGYVAITLLPPLGIHLLFKLTGASSQAVRGVLFVAYAAALAFACFFLLSGHGMEGSRCLGNYVIFSTAPEAARWYGLYYYGLVVGGAGLAAGLATQAHAKNLRVALYSMAIGYLAFLVPTTTANILDPSTVAGIPSIMCGFAVIFALILTGFTVPRAMKERR